MRFEADGQDLQLLVSGWDALLKTKPIALKEQAFHEAVHQAATSPLNERDEPTAAQKHAGNYKMGHVEFQGLPIAIENPRGSFRRGVDPGGKPWACEMAHHYGYIKRTMGADGDAVDCFIGPELESPLVIILDQVNPRTGEFDEHKILLGFGTEEEAVRGYLACYEPGWQGIGGTRECDIEDLKRWLAEPPREIKKALGEADSDGARWITVHPHGEDGPGHPVRIRPVKGSSGAFHVVGGAGGKLNGLRLQHVKSPEEYKAASKARHEAERAAQKEKKAQMSPEEREGVKKQKAAASEQRKAAERRFIETVAKAQGLNPEELDFQGGDEEGAKLAHSKRHQELLHHAMKAAKEAEKRLKLDAQARMQAGLQQTGGDHQLTVEDLLTVSAVDRGPGYQRNLSAKAREAGQTAEDLADHVAELRLRAAENRVEDGRFTDAHVELGGGDPVQGIQLAGAAMGEQARAAHMKAKTLKAASDGAVKEALKEAVADNTQLAEILTARRALRETQKQLRSGKGPIFEKGYQANLGELTEAVIQDAEDRLRTDRMMDFLKEVDEANPEEETVNLGKAPSEDGLHASRHLGAWDALQEIGLAAFGVGAIDRDTVEVLGPDGAAVVMARALRRAFPPEDQEDLHKALAEVHLEEQDKDLPAVVEEMGRLRQEAKAVQDELAANAKDLAVAHQMQKNKVALLKEARRQLGGALGRMEARAALLMALKEPPKDSLTIPLGNASKETVATIPAAMGLKDGDYTLDYDTGEGLLTLTGQGQDRLLKPVDPALQGERDLAVAIKRGQLDEEGWLPNGFAKRTPSRFDNPLLEAPQFRSQLDIHPEATPEDLQQAIRDHVGGRIADGERPADILADLFSATTMADRVPQEQWGAYIKEVEQAFPLRAPKVDAQGRPVYLKDQAGVRIKDPNGNYIQATDAVPIEKLQPHFQEMAESYLKQKGLSGDHALHAQRLDSDSSEFYEAIHRSIAEDPRTAAAFIPPGELSNDHQQAIRDFFYKEIAKKEAPKAQAAKKPEAEGQAVSQDHEAALRAAGPEPPKFEESLFGDPQESYVWTEWNNRYQGALEAIKNGQGADLEAHEGKLNPGQQAKASASSLSPWAEFVQSMGGVKSAQQAVQEVMAGRFASRFKEHHEKLTGHGLKEGFAPLASAKTFVASTGSQEEREAFDAQKRREDDALRQRGLGGRYAEGGIAHLREQALQRKASAAMGQASFFSPEEIHGKGQRPGERLTLGATLENQIRAAMPAVAAPFSGQLKPVDIHDGTSMSGRYAAQQRAVKGIVNLHRIGLFYGAGSGKTPIMLGALSELRNAGKVRKAFFAVPSAVQAQFGAEAIKFLDPKSGTRVHARPGETFEERLNAYRDPEAHGVVVTHQGLRDDTLKVLGDHLGKKGEALTGWIHEAPREELAKTVRDAWARAGVNWQALFLDEGHNALNRAGKEDSTLAKIIDAIGDSSDYYAGATGDPIKNDASEAFDWLSKMDAKRYPAKARAEFMARYGKDTAMARRSLQAELARYFFVERVHPGVEAHQHIVTAEVTPKQQEALSRIEKASADLSLKQNVLAAAKELDPRAFEGKPEEEHEAIAQGIRKANGTFRDAAYNRILHCDPEGGSVQKTIQEAKDSLAEGKPPIIFAHNLDAVDAIHQAMQAAGLKSVTLTGKDSSKDKAAKIAKFRPQGGVAPEADVLVMSDAGATGINAQRGQTVIHHDIPMTHMVHSQRTARAWRLGQRHDVNVRTVVADHPFDHENLRRLKHKESLASIFKSPEGFLDDSGTAERLRQIRVRQNQRQGAA